MIHVERLQVRYGATEVLRGLSLHVEAGELLLLTGPTGCGKSTLAYCLNGLIPHTFPTQVQGRVVVGGLDVRHHPVPRLAQEAGLVLQLPETQLFNLRVEEEVAFGPRNLGLSGEEVQRRVRWALDVAGLADDRERRVTSLSGGEKQRLVIASVLAMRPRVLVLDEPLSNLDAAGTRSVLETLDRLRRQGAAIVVIEHKTPWVAPWADRIAVMDAGQIVWQGTPQEAAGQGALLESLGVRAPFSTGEEELAPRPAVLAPDAGEPAVLLEEVRFRYGQRPLLEGVSLALPQGAFAALVGPNGAGKSTLARIVAGLLRPDAGSVRLARRRWGPASRLGRIGGWLRALGGRERLAWGQEVGLLLQNPLEQLFCDTVEEEVAFGPANYGQAVDGQVDRVLAGTGLAGLRHRPVVTLSAGEKQRLALAAIVALSPPLLILDEPTLGQDWGHLCRLMDIVEALNRRGSTVLLISHDLDMVRRYARRLFYLEEGRVREGRRA